MMPKVRTVGTLTVVIVCLASADAAWPAQERASLAGRWTLDRGLSQFPREVGFGADLIVAGAPGEDTGGSRGGLGSGGREVGAWMSRRESADDARRLELLTEEVRNPPARLTIDETPAAVVITSGRQPARTFRLDGRESVIQLDGVPVVAIARWEANHLSIVYKVEQGRDLRYTFSATPNPRQLVVDVKFIERGGRDSIRRVYAPGHESTEDETAAGAAPPAVPLPAVPPPAAGAPDDSRSVAPGLLDPRQASPIDQRPDAELRGLASLGLVVEDLSPQAAACGLAQNAIRAAAAKSLSSTGLKVRENADEDTYVYVNIMTTSASTGLCVSRYDVFLYTHTTATLSYQSRPVLVQVSLLHKGGIAGGASAAHAESVLQGVTQYVDQFATRIRDANR